MDPTVWQQVVANDWVSVNCDPGGDVIALRHKATSQYAKCCTHKKDLWVVLQDLPSATKGRYLFRLLAGAAMDQLLRLEEFEAPNARQRSQGSNLTVSENGTKRHVLELLIRFDVDPTQFLVCSRLRTTILLTTFNRHADGSVALHDNCKEIALYEECTR